MPVSDCATVIRSSEMKYLSRSRVESIDACADQALQTEASQHYIAGEFGSRGHFRKRSPPSPNIRIKAPSVTLRRDMLSLSNPQQSLEIFPRLPHQRGADRPRGKNVLDTRILDSSVRRPPETRG